MTDTDDLYQTFGVQPPDQSNTIDLYEQYAVRPQAVASTAPQNATNWIADALHHATGGLSDKAEALLKASGVMPGGVQAGDFSDRYHKTLTNVRSDIADYETQNPGWTGAKTATAVGDIAPLLIGAPEAAAAKTLTSAGLKAGATGAAVGAGYGLGATDDESLGQDLTAMGIGGAAGGLTGAALPIGLGIAGAPFRLSARGATAFGKGGAERAAGRVLNDATGGSMPVFETPPLHGMAPSTGQVTNDPGLLWLERSVSDASRTGAALGAESRTANNTAIRGAISDLGNTGSDASTAMSKALENAQAKMKADNQALWKKADVANTGGVSGFQFNNFMQKHIGSLPVADQSAVPQDVVSVMQKMAEAKTQNLSDVQAVRSMLSAKATMAARSGDKNTARILGGLADKVEGFIDLKAANLGQTIPDYNAARAHTAQMKQTFNTPPAIRKALGVDAYGADKLPVSATADHFINAGKGAPETFQSYLNAIGTKDPKTGKVTYDPDGLKAAQDAFTQKFLGTVTSVGTDANGQSLVSPAKIQKFLGDYAHVINSPAFDSSQRDLVGRIAKASQMASRTANARPPGGGSDTFAKLSGDRFIDALIGPGASKLIDLAGTAGGAVAGYLSHGLVGAAGGAFGGEKIAAGLSKLYAAPRDRVVTLVTEAMHDPDLAKALMQKASGGNFKLLKPATRSKMLGILGAQTETSVTNADPQ